MEGVENTAVERGSVHKKVVEGRDFGCWCSSLALVQVDLDCHNLTWKDLNLDSELVEVVVLVLALGLSLSNCLVCHDVALLSKS